MATILALASVWDDSFIVDEIPHVGAGYSYVAKGDMRLNPEHPPLPKDLAGLAIRFLNLNDEEVFRTKFWTEDINGQWEFGRRLIFNSGHDAELITRVAKIPPLFFFVASAILIFYATHKLYGSRAAFLALTLFSFSPTVLAHSRFVTTDVPALFGTLFATYFFIRYLKDPSRPNFWWTAVMFGITLLTKFSTFLLVPYFLLLALIYGLIQVSCKKIRQVTFHLLRSISIFAVGFVIVVWPTYYFHTWHYPPKQQHRDTQYLLGSFGRRALADPVVWASDKPILRAVAQYSLGLLMVTQRSTGGNTTYFWGEVSRWGWKSYFPIVYFIKEPLAWWGLVIMALLAPLTQVARLAGRKKSLKLKVKNMRDMGDWVKNHFEEFAMLLWIAIYWATTLRSNLNIGVRHLLPVYPFTIMLVAGQIERIRQKLKTKHQNYNPKSKIYNVKLSFYILPFTIYILIGWYLLENIKIFPYYLAYFNQVIGGPSQGYKYVVDSNLDWGQDLKRLAQWIEKNNIPKIEMDYFGWADPVYYLSNRYIWTSSTKYKDANDFITNNQSNGWLAISLTFLQGSEGPPDQYKPINYLWLKNYSPVATVGHSIFVYHLTK